MLTRLLPLGLKVDFQDRLYKLGETVNLTLELSPRREIEVREARVDLVCDIRYAEVITVVKRRGPLNPGAKRMGHGFFSATRQTMPAGQSRDVWGARWRRPDNAHGAGLQRGETPFLLPPEERRVTKQRRATYAHSSVVYMRDERLPSGRANTHVAGLKIQPEPPSHGSEGSVHWTLVATVDIAGARDVRARRQVSVTLA